MIRPICYKCKKTMMFLPDHMLCGKPTDCWSCKECGSLWREEYVRGQQDFFNTNRVPLVY